MHYINVFRLNVNDIQVGYIYCMYLCQHVFVCISVYMSMYVCASDDEEHQWYYFRMDLCLRIMFVVVSMYVCMYVCIYVIYFLQFMVISIILTRVFYFMCLQGEDLLSAAGEGDVAAVERILSARPDLINYQGMVGRAME